MTCQYCGTQMCQCLNQGMSQAQLRNQVVAIRGIAAQQAAYGIPWSGPKEPTAEEKFLNLIDGKSDEEIVIAFETLMMDEHKVHEDLMRKLRNNYENGCKARRDNFMAMCKRFRPSINEELIKRMSNMKAFW